MKVNQVLYAIQCHLICALISQVSYSGVTMALIHGGQPDHIILCHEPTRTHMRGLPHYDVPTLEALYQLVLPLAKISNPNCKISGICINTKNMDHLEAEDWTS